MKIEKAQKQGNFLAYVCIGILFVLLVYFVYGAFMSAGSVFAKSQITNNNFDTIKVEEEESGFHAGTVAFTLNYNEFADYVVVQVGSLGNIQKDGSYFYYVFEKTMDNNVAGLEFDGVMEKHIWNDAWGVYNVCTYHTVAEDSEYCNNMLQHEFTHIYTGDILNIDGAKVHRPVYGWFANIFTDIGSKPYLTLEADTYVPANDTYELFLKFADIYSVKFIQEIYSNGYTADKLLSLKDDYFTCYSYVNDLLTPTSGDGFVNFDLKCSLDYKNLKLTNFNFDNLGVMYDLVKDYTFYIPA